MLCYTTYVADRFTLNNRNKNDLTLNNRNNNKAKEINVFMWHVTYCTQIPPEVLERVSEKC